MANKRSFRGSAPARTAGALFFAALTASTGARAEPTAPTAPTPATTVNPKFSAARAPGPQLENRDTLRQGALSAARLTSVAARLGDKTGQTREAAIEELRTLPADMLPAIKARATMLGLQRIDRRAAISVLESLIRAASTSAPARAGKPDTLSAKSSGHDPATVDLSAGASTVLQAKRDRTTRAIVEAALLLKSLENLGGTMHSAEVGLCMAEFMDLADGAFRNELRRVQDRSGRWLLPAMIALRSDPRKPIKRWAQAGVRKLGADDVANATNLADPHLLAQVVLAYSDPPDYDAMPTVVRLTRNKHLQVRQAARLAVQRFGKNAIWQLRELYEELTSKPAPRKWNTARTAQALYAVMDKPSGDVADPALSSGLQHWANRDLEAMAVDFEIALASASEHARRAEMAPGYAALGDKRLAEHSYAAAEDAYRTALHLGRNGSDRGHYEVQLKFSRAQHDLARGVVDLAAFEKILELDPQHQGARDALARVDGTRSAKRKYKKRVALAGGLLLLAVAAFLTLRFVLRATQEDAQPPSA